MKNNIGFFGFALLSFALVISSCFSPLDYNPEGGNTGIRVTVGGGSSSAGRSVVNESAFRYRLVFTGPNGRLPPLEAFWGETVTVDAVPGIWSVDIEAFDPATPGLKKAIGTSYNIEVKRGEINNASVKMAVYTEISNWAQLKTAVEQGTYDEFILLTGDLLVGISDSTINLTVEKEITIAAGGDINIDIESPRAAGSGSLFSVSGEGHLILGSASNEYSGSFLIDGNANAPFVSVSSNGAFTMNRAEMTGNFNSPSNGGVIYNEGTFIMNGGVISGNSSSSSGTGVYNRKTFIMNGGEISGNNSAGPIGKGGGVYNAGTFTMNGGIIEGNTASLYGNGVYNDGIFEMAGNAFVDGNNEVFLAQNRYVTVNRPLTREIAARLELLDIDYFLERPLLSGTAVSAMKAKFAVSSSGTMWVNNDGELTGWFVETIGGAGDFGYPNGIAFGPGGIVYFVDTPNHYVYKIDAGGNISVFAGNGIAGFANGDSENAQFSFPTDVVVDAEGNVYVADSENHRIRKIDVEGNVTTFAGNGEQDFVDNPALEASFNYPECLAIDKTGIYVMDFGNYAVRKIHMDEEAEKWFVDTLAGGRYSTPPDDGPADMASFFFPGGIAVDDSGNIYVTDEIAIWNSSIGNDEYFGVIRKIYQTDDDYMVETIKTDSALGCFSDIAVDSAGNIYATDYDNHQIQKITPGGNVSTVAGIEDFPGHEDGLAASARFNEPSGIAIKDGAIYVADTGNSAIRKITMP